MARLVTIGCSVTCGSGLNPEFLDEDKSHPDLWVNLVHKNIFPHLKVENPSIPGSGFREHFETASQYLASQHHSEPIDTLIIGWTTVPRYIIYTGLETYDTRFFTHSKVFRDIQLHDITWTKNFLEKFAEEFKALHHSHYDILKIVLYSNILIDIARLAGTKIYFVAAMNWDKNYFTRLTPEEFSPAKLTPLTQKLLHTDTRSDKEIFTLYNQMHDDYDRAGGINRRHWVNADDPMWPKTHGMDKSHDGLHTGPKGHHFMYELIKKHIESQQTL